jgi:hypothetical protein
MFEDTARLRCSSISLEDGADEACLDGEPIGLCEEGMCFPSRWQFAPGTSLAMTLEISGTGQRVRAEGVVVACDAIGHRFWAVTLMFIDKPEGLGAARTLGADIREDLDGTPIAPGR